MIQIAWAGWTFLQDAQSTGHTIVIAYCLVRLISWPFNPGYFPGLEKASEVKEVCRFQEPVTSLKWLKSAVVRRQVILE